MTKIKTYIACIPIIIGFLGSFCLGLDGRNHGELDADFPFKSESTSNLKCDGNTDLGSCTSIKEDEKAGEDTIIRRLLGVFGLNKEKKNDLKFIDYVKAIMNMAIGLVTFITLVMCIYTFYLMIFSENEAGIKKAKGNLVGIAIALGVIGMARLIVSVIFRRYQSYRREKTDTIEKLGAENLVTIENNIIYNENLSNHLL